MKKDTAHNKPAAVARTFYLFLLLTFVAPIAASSQSLTGTWQGEIVGDNEFLQLNIVQTHNQLCGYSWDYVYSQPRNHCKANFSGYFDHNKKRWFAEGTNFLENSGDHVLMQMVFTLSADKKTLSGSCRAKPDFPFSDETSSPIVLHRVSTKPTLVTPEMRDCLAAARPVHRPLPTTVSPNHSAVPQKRQTPVIRRTAPTKRPPPDIPASPKLTAPKSPSQPADNTVPEFTAGRVNREFRRINIEQNEVTLYIYDNAEVDGDSISVFYNNRLLRSHLRLTEKPIILAVDLDSTVGNHSLVIYAENLGSIPPNTALIVFTDKSGHRYELFSRATLRENAELIFTLRRKD